MFTLTGALTSLPYIIATVALAIVYNVVLDNPAIVREARAGYVNQATVAALEASNTELKRQATASRELAEAWQKSYTRYQDVVVEREQALEEKIKTYEADPANADRCKFSDSDIEFLRK